MLLKLSSLSMTFSSTTTIKRPKNAKLEWTAYTELSFIQAKEDLATATLLSYPALSAELLLAADASDTAIGAVLQQRNPTMGDLEPLAFFSRRLTHSQKKWTIFSRELLAVYSGLRHFLYFLQGCDFIILTVHQALLNAAENAGECQLMREARQLHFIGEHTSKWQHIPGSSNITADTLSHAVSSYCLKFYQHCFSY